MTTLDPFAMMVPAGFAWLYALVGGIEFGLPLAALLKETGAHRRPVQSFSPVWEASNVLLGGVLAAMFALFPAVLPAVGPLLQPIWLLVAGLLIIRLCLVLWQGYGQQSRLGQWLLAAVSLALPAVLIQTLTVLLTGDADLLAHLGLAIALGALAIVLAVGLWGGFFYRPGQPSRQSARLSYWLALLLSLFTLPLALLLDGSVLAGRDITTVMWPIPVAVVLGVACLASERRRRYFAASALLVTGLAATLALTQWPYIVRPTIRIDEAVAGTFAETWVLAAGGLALLVVLTCLIWLYRTAREQA